jgi:hypothetical protein
MKNTKTHSEIFELDNFPINPDIIEGAKKGNALDILHINLRAMGIIYEMQKMNSEDLTKLIRTVKGHEGRIKCLEQKVEVIDDLKEKVRVLEQKVA